MSGIYRAVLDGDGMIDMDAWAAAVAGFQMVGICDACREPLRPERPRKERHITWYTALCVGCGHEVSSPNGRLRVR